MTKQTFQVKIISIVISLPRNNTNKRLILNLFWRPVVLGARSPGLVSKNAAADSFISSSPPNICVISWSSMPRSRPCSSLLPCLQKQLKEHLARGPKESEWGGWTESQTEVQGLTGRFCMSGGLPAKLISLACGTAHWRRPSEIEFFLLPFVCWWLQEEDLFLCLFLSILSKQHAALLLRLFLSSRLTKGRSSRTHFPAGDVIDDATRMEGNDECCVIAVDHVSLILWWFLYFHHLYCYFIWFTVRTEGRHFFF